MAETRTMARAGADRRLRADSRPLTIRTIGFDDLKEALRKGLADFQEQPSHLIFLGLIYPIAGLFLARLAFGYDVLPLLFPLAAGFALVGPFAAIGIYEISRRRELGLDTSWRHAFGVLRSPQRGAILALGTVLLVLFLAWLVAAMLIYRLIFAGEPASLSGFLAEVLTTERGWLLILVGNGVGFLFAAAALVVSVVSFPLLVDRDVDAATAMRTSFAAVKANPVPMALWGLIVAALLVAGSIPLLVGLAVVVPVLGHATWHLYRRTVGP